MKFFCSLFALPLLFSCTHNGDTASVRGPSAVLLAQTNARVNSIIDRIQSGDIVFRTGADFTSSSLQKICRRDKSFSHCGIAVREHDSVFIYHALGGEFNPDQRIRKEFAGNFFHPRESYRAGICRFSETQLNKRKLLLVADRLYKARIPFDLDFDLKTDDRLYCAEFVAKSLETAFVKREKINRSRIDTMEFIGPDDIFLHPGAAGMRFPDYRIY